ncbi:HAD-like protein [Sistotremastrum suecicum HHB10207 ss-3]|uniref:HAD-like protein n=1 Tax=Sistotremastrum suecicum HHB10207 ss-3 TaxID=1314776 RepID=A0A166FKT8_9AGAM|nr:HAD-like protein [Sistotremastrum suecicum HHB10207 ss-3]
MSSQSLIAPIDYVLFDMDGLLIDSERIYTEVTNQILARYGKEMTWEIKAGLMGKPERPAAEHLLSFFPDIDLTVDQYLSERKIGQDALWPTVRPLPGAQKLVEHLSKHKIPIAVATSSIRRNYLLKSTPNRALFDLFGKNVVCADDGLIDPKRGKPCPDIFLVAAKLLGKEVGTGDLGANHDDENVVSGEEKIVRGRGLVFEDAVPGVLAAQRAGMKVIWVPDERLLALGDSAGFTGDLKADQTLNSLDAFIPEQWGLPPYQ